MAIGDLVVEDLQFEYNGLLFGDCCVTGMDFIDAAGFDLVTVRTGDVNRPRDHGMIAGTDFLAGRTVDITLAVHGSTIADFDTKLDSLSLLSNGMGMTENPLVFQIPGQTKRRINARLRKRNFPVDFGYVKGKAVTMILRFEATDPRIYDNTATTLGISLPVSSGGLGWPVGWPLGWSSSTSGSATFFNAGTFETRPVVTFIGPLTSPNIQNLTTGLQWSSIFDLQSGDQLVVDFLQRTVLLNGTASRYSYVTAASNWWTLIPGNNVLTIGAAAGSGSATVTARSAWM
jgi:Phage tail protein